jgi:hypothetical protein
LAATEKLTVPFPLPFAGDVIVMKLLPLVAVQSHPPAVVTFTLPEPPAAVKF